MRNGEKLRSFDVPIERRTRAPAPSDCSMARKAWRIARGTVMFVGLLEEKKLGGTRGSPMKKDVELEDSLAEGPFVGFWVVEKMDASGD